VLLCVSLDGAVSDDTSAIGDMRISEWGAGGGGTRIDRGDRNTRRNPAPVTFYPPQMSLGTKIRNTRRCGKWQSQFPFIGRGPQENYVSSWSTRCLPRSAPKFHKQDRNIEGGTQIHNQKCVTISLV
jgi:hypothetical protein